MTLDNNAPNAADVEPWYKQFWPWFLIALPSTSVVLGIMLVVIAANTDDSLVIDDYYKEGKAINAKLDKVIKARELGIAAELMMDGPNISLRFTSGQSIDGSALKLQFFHPTLQNQDFEVTLLKSADAYYRFTLPHSIEGKWLLTLVPFDQKWKIQQPVVLPKTSTISLIP